jgi:hypothetical protein
LADPPSGNFLAVDRIESGIDLMPLSNAERQKRHREKTKALLRERDRNELVEELRSLYLKREHAFQERGRSFTPEDYLRSQLIEDADPFFVGIIWEMLTGERALPPSFKPRSTKLRLDTPGPPQPF